MNMLLSHDPSNSARQLHSLRGARIIRIDGEVECVSRKVRFLHESWLRMSAGGSPPDWSQFDVIDHRSVVEHLYLIKRTAPREWAFVLRGEAVQEIHPRQQPTGRVVDLHEPAIAANLLDYYDMISETGACHMVRGTIVNDREDHIDIESIDCPFTDRRRGGHVILGLIERVSVRQSPAF